MRLPVSALGVLTRAYHFEEVLVYTTVTGQFGMEGSGKDIGLPDEDRAAVSFRKKLDVMAYPADAGSADKHHLEWTTCEGCFGLIDGAVVLSPVGIPFNGRV